MLRLDDVTKVFKTGTFGGKALTAVSGVTFEVGPGEVVSLIGESGSGKTTVGRMILRLTAVTGGSITFDGQDVATFGRRELHGYYGRVQGVFQDPFSSYNPIFKADRVFDVIKQEYFPHVGRNEWGNKVDHALESVGLNPREVLNKYPHQLSGGQLQRMLIGRALLLDIDFLVADEIISMLDASTRVDVLNLLADLKSRGLSILFITHDLSLGYYISERAVILYQGRIAEMGTAEKVLTNPQHPYTKMLMASVAHLHEKWPAGEDDRPPRQIEVAGGCVYYGRCPVADRSLGCDRQTPELFEVEPDHLVACFVAAQQTDGGMA